MAETKIEWADAVWNPITGCTPISEACEHCYAKRMANRLAGRYGYPAYEPFRVMFHPERLKEPTIWRKPRRIFVCSMADLFHEDVAYEWISAVMLVASICSHHTFMILTKRPDRMKAYFDSNPFGYTQGAALAEFCKYLPTISPGGRRDRINGDGTINGNGNNEWPLPNVIGMVTAENQQRADERIPDLLASPFAMRGVSIEPMLGPVNIERYLPEHDYRPTYDYYRTMFPKIGNKPIPIRRGIDWVICGGETGPGARPMHPDWARSLRDQCQAAVVPFFFKQWGEWAAATVVDDSGFYGGRAFDNPAGGRQSAVIRERSTKAFQSGTTRLLEPGDVTAGGVMMLDRNIVAVRVGKKAAGRLIDGREWSEFPDQK